MIEENCDQCAYEYEWPWSTKTIQVANHPLGTTAKKGDTLRVMMRRRSGWMVREFTVTLAYKHCISV